MGQAPTSMGVGHCSNCTASLEENFGMDCGHSTRVFTADDYRASYNRYG